jgi:phosphopantothenoylcysteine decarboxylase/phosphopantothenate--cysteine ligase
MYEHPSVDIIGSLGNELEGKTVVLGIAGSVASVRSADIARKLMRHGAKVIPVMTKAATELIHPNMLEWSTGVKPVTELTGQIEHVDYVGNVPTARGPLPCGSGYRQHGRKICLRNRRHDRHHLLHHRLRRRAFPVIVVPAMHQAMYNHPFVLENLDKSLKPYGVQVIDSRGGGRKGQDPRSFEEIFQEVIKAVLQSA